MKASTALAFLLALAFSDLSAPTQARLQPTETQVSAALLDDTTINSGPSGAMLEAAYFRAPHSPFATVPLAPCRLQVRIFDKTRLAQSCN